jgi:hypothetical protein
VNDPAILGDFVEVLACKRQIDIIVSVASSLDSSETPVSNPYQELATEL